MIQQAACLKKVKKKNPKGELKGPYLKMGKTWKSREPTSIWMVCWRRSKEVIK
jgi:hypothetical protein